MVYAYLLGGFLGGLLAMFFDGKLTGYNYFSFILVWLMFGVFSDTFLDKFFEWAKKKETEDNKKRII